MGYLGKENLETGNKTELVNRVLELQLRLTHHTKDELSDAWLALNLTIPQLKSLFFIKFKKVTNFKTLAEAMGVTASNVTGIIDRLVVQGLVQREENPENRRMLTLRLTRKGDALLNELGEQSSSQFSHTLDTIDIEDLEALSRGLKALASAAEHYQASVMASSTSRQNSPPAY
jgi:DNA-binding MarR family transcriptional regulator